MAERTPLPWSLDERDPALAIGPDGKPVADCVIFNPRQARPIAEAEANAALIVRAVNAHEELVAALENLIIGIGMGWDLEGMIEAGNAALARAKGEPA